MQIRSRLFLQFLMLAAPGLASCADYGTITFGDEKPLPLVAAAAYIPKFKTVTDGDPDVVVMLATQPLDAAMIDWLDPSLGARSVSHGKDDQLVVLLHFEHSQVHTMSLRGDGINDDSEPCLKCKANVQRSGDAFKGTLDGETRPYRDSTHGIRVHAHFDFANVHAQNFGEPLPADGGEARQAYLAYAKACNEGDYATMKRMLPLAERLWGLYADAAERRQQIIDSCGAPKHPQILHGWQTPASAVLVIADPDSPRAPASLLGIGLGKVGGQWQVREEVGIKEKAPGP